MYEPPSATVTAASYAGHPFVSPGVYQNSHWHLMFLFVPAGPDKAPVPTWSPPHITFVASQKTMLYIHSHHPTHTLTLEMEATCTSKMLVTLPTFTQFNNPRTESPLITNNCESLKSITLASCIPNCCYLVVLKILCPLWNGFVDPAMSSLKDYNVK